MKYLGTTGTRNIAQNDEPLYVDYLTSEENSEYFSQFNGFVSGACIGWDAVFGSTMALTYPDKEHVVIVPADRSRIEEWWIPIECKNLTIIEMPEGSSYKDRNEEIVNRSDELFYCADWPEAHGKSKRSGTWQTVRLARSAKIEVQGIIINDEKDEAHD